MKGVSHTHPPPHQEPMKKGDWGGEKAFWKGNGGSWLIRLELDGDAYFYARRLVKKKTSETVRKRGLKNR